ncbi:MAG: LysM peptidoglycan-binding domain-containing protein [Anaerolineae bacterium]|nr:LysM peptidoglycan-binding domain-containing protein [Anaerolineae bacterium]
MKSIQAAGCILLLAGFLFSVPISAQETEEGVTIHVVQRGETLSRIATSYGVTLTNLARINGIVDPGNIQVGQRLLVPGGDVPLPTPEPTHVVRPGETLRSIANFYGRPIADLIALNGIGNPDSIYVGQVLRILPESEGLTRADVTPEPTSPPENSLEPTSEPVQAAPTESPPEDTAEPPIEYLTHVVQRGETLFRIATQYGLTVNDLVRANGISDPTLIYAGQRLIIPGVEATEVAAVDLPEPFTSIDVYPQTLIEGKTARVRITTRVPTLLSGTFLNREVGFGDEENHTIHTILQGIPVFTAAGVYPLDMVAVDMAGGPATAYSLNLQVQAGPYGREYIRLLAGRDNLLDTDVEQAELNLLERVTKPFTEPRQFNGPMGLPAAATVISPFGTRRSYNGGAFDRFHSGTDFAGAPGTPILATAPGQVVLADTLNVRGLATVIDHGWGIYTTYSHQSQQYVKVGDYVTTGQVIGAVGSSGRVTGAHLHWEIWVGGVLVDPMQWVQFSFT